MAERQEQGAGAEAGAVGSEETAPAPEPAGGRRLSTEEPLAEMFADLLGKLWRRGRVEVEKAARKGRERLTLRQLRTDRDRMYQKLGKEARQLVESGEIQHPGLRKGVERIKELEAKLLEAEDAVRARGGDPDEGLAEGSEAPEAEGGEP